MDQRKDKPNNRQRMEVPDTFACTIDKSLPPWMRLQIFRNLQRVSKDPDCFAISCRAPETKIWAELAFNVDRLYAKGLRSLFFNLNDSEENHPYQVLKRAHQHAIEAGENIKEACSLLNVRYRDPRGLRDAANEEKTAGQAENKGDTGTEIDLTEGPQRKGQKKAASAG